MKKFFLVTVLFLAALTSSFAEDKLSVLTPGSSGWQVMIAQSLLCEHLDQKLDLDGKWGRMTSAAWARFQETEGRLVSKKLDADGWKVLFGKESRYVLRFNCGTSRKDEIETRLDERLYESNVTLTEYRADGCDLVGQYRGSIMPDNMDIKGRIRDGWYEISLGFHRRSMDSRVLVPTASDLRVKLAGTLRPCLVVNRDRKVPVISNNVKKRFSTTIHVHNGFPSGPTRGSEGCQTIQSNHWPSLISHFLKRYPELRNWYDKGHHDGKTVGVLIVHTRQS